MSPDRPVLFHNNPRCSKFGGALALLRERGIEPEVVDLVVTPLTVAQLRDLAAKLDVPVRAMLRTGEPVYAELSLDDERLDDEALIAAMAAHPVLVERPLLVHAGRAVVGRPPERVLSLFDAG